MDDACQNQKMRINHFFFDLFLINTVTHIFNQISPNTETISTIIYLFANNNNNDDDDNRGSYYDPQGIFCGKYDCYKILGFDYESWGRAPPSKKELTQSYRTMSKLWHPDKNKDAGAKDRFVVRFSF